MFPTDDTRDSQTPEQLAQARFDRASSIYTTLMLEPTVENTWRFADALSEDWEDLAQRVMGLLRQDVDTYIMEQEGNTELLEKVWTHLETEEAKHGRTVEREAPEHLEGLCACDFESKDEWDAAQLGKPVPSVANFKLVWLAVAFHAQNDIKLSTATIEALKGIEFQKPHNYLPCS